MGGKVHFIEILHEHLGREEERLGSPGGASQRQTQICSCGLGGGAPEVLFDYEWRLTRALLQLGPSAHWSPEWLTDGRRALAGEVKDHRTKTEMLTVWRFGHSSMHAVGSPSGAGEQQHVVSSRLVLPVTESAALSMPML